MDFRLSEADRVLIEHVREFGAKYFNQDTVAQWRSDMGLPDEVVRDFVNLDFNGFGVIHRRDHVRYAWNISIRGVWRLHSRCPNLPPARTPGA